MAIADRMTAIKKTVSQVERVSLEGVAFICILEILKLTGGQFGNV